MNKHTDDALERIILEYTYLSVETRTRALEELMRRIKVKARNRLTGLLAEVMPREGRTSIQQLKEEVGKELWGETQHPFSQVEPATANGKTLARANLDMSTIENAKPTPICTCTSENTHNCAIHAFDLLKPE